MKKSKDVLDMDELELLENGGMLEEALRLRDLHNRKLYLSDLITDFIVEDVIRHILEYNTEDKGLDIKERKPILLYITSNGGSVDAGFGLIDAIKNSKTPVYTINLAHQYSMAFLIGLAGHKRYAMKHAQFLMHDGVSGVFDSGSKAQDKMEFNKAIEEKIRDHVLEHTNVTLKEYNKKLRVEWYLFAEEAKKWGMVDYIIGKDCDMDEII